MTPANIWRHARSRNPFYYRSSFIFIKRQDVLFGQVAIPSITGLRSYIIIEKGLRVQDASRNPFYYRSSFIYEGDEALVFRLTVAIPSITGLRSYGGIEAGWGIEAVAIPSITGLRSYCWALASFFSALRSQSLLLQVFVHIGDKSWMGDK